MKGIAQIDPASTELPAVLVDGFQVSLSGELIRIAFKDGDVYRASVAMSRDNSDQLRVILAKIGVRVITPIAPIPIDRKD